MLRVHLRTLSSNETHPRASLPLLGLNQAQLGTSFFRYSRKRFIVRIYLDMLGVLFRFTAPDSVLPTPKDILAVWQWTSGRRLATLRPPPNMVFSDFTFVERDQLLVTHSSSFAGPIISTMRLPCARFYSTSPDISTIPVNCYLPQVALRLPAPPSCTNQCLDIIDIKIVNDPSPCAPSYTISRDNPVPTVFTPDSSPESAMIALSITIVLHPTQHSTERTAKHVLLARTSIFTCFRSIPPIEPVPQIAFDKWSLGGVHWLYGLPGFLHGQRYARTVLERGQTYVEILDFNPCHVPAPVSGWQALMKVGREESPSVISPKMSLFKTRASPDCSHKYYLDYEKLRSNMRYKRQRMRIGLVDVGSECVLDCERIIILEVRRLLYLSVASLDRNFETG
jgi:hypothetical protein